MCPYCAYRFVPGPTGLEIAGVTSSTPATKKQLLLQRLRLLGFCSLVFFAVATFAYKFRYEEHYPPTVSTVIASTYALRDIPLYRGRSLDGTPRRVPQTAVLDITEFELEGSARDWIQVRYGGVTGYVRPSDVAPPKARDMGQGYALLRGYLSNIDNASVASLAADAIDHYRQTSGSEPRADELDWTLAERLRSMKRTPEAIRVEKLEYGKLIAKPGQYNEQARDRMSEVRTQQPASERDNLLSSRSSDSTHRH